MAALPLYIYIMIDHPATTPSAERVRQELDIGEALTYAELTLRLGFSERQLRRAIKVLCDIGVRIEATGKPLRFRIHDEHRRQPVRMIPLSNEEILALQLAAQASRAALAPTPLVVALDSAFSRLLFEITTRAISFDEEAQRRQWHFGEAAQSEFRADVFNILRESVDEHRSVLLDYVTAKNGRAYVRRKVDPYCIAMRGGTWMLIGWCHLRQAIREFNIAGITLALPSDPEHDPRAFFDMPEEFDPEMYFRDRFRYIGGADVYVVRLLVEQRHAIYFQRKSYHSTQQIEELRNDGRIVVSYEVEGLDEIRSFAQSWGIGITVLEPEELVERMRSDATALIQRYTAADPVEPTIKKNHYGS